MSNGSPADGNREQAERRAWVVGFNNETWCNLFLREGSVSMGWSDVTTDISALTSHEAIIDATTARDSVHPRNPAVQLRKFAHEAQVGDIIVLKNGLRYRSDDKWQGKATIRAIGVIDSDYTYQDPSDRYGELPPTARNSVNTHHRDVNWILNFDELIGGAFTPEVPINRWTFEEFDDYLELKSQLQSSRGLTDHFSELEAYADQAKTQHRDDQPTVWIEKSYHNRDDRDVDGWGLGDALWCPQTRTDGGSSVYYDNATDVEPGDVILHLDQHQRAFTAASLAAATYEETTCLEDTEWDDKGVSEMGYSSGERPAYRVPLTEYEEFATPLDVDEVLTEANGDVLHDLRDDHTVVYSKNLNLNQGAYLTEAPPAFVELISAAARTAIGDTLPHLDRVGSTERIETLRTDSTDTEPDESEQFDHPTDPLVQYVQAEEPTIYGLTAPADYWVTALKYRALGFEDTQHSQWANMDPGDVLIFHAGGEPMHPELSRPDGFVFGVAIVGSHFETDEQWWYDDIYNTRTYPYRVAFDRLFLTPGAAVATDLPDATDSVHELTDAISQLQRESIPIGTVNERCDDATGNHFPSRQFISILDDDAEYGRGEAVIDLLVATTAESSPIATTIEFSGTIDPDAFSGIVFPDAYDVPSANELADQITAAVRAGDHIIFTGPPGTGKTEIAQQVTAHLTRHYPHLYSGYQVTTATADWSTFDTVGGYMPTESTDEERSGDLAFTSGIVLNRLKNTKTGVQANEPIIIDELNRADIDKGFGQLFTLLSGQPVQLPYTKHNNEIELLTTDHLDGTPADYQYLVPDSWHIFATMNSYDKTSLYEMSYAFMRRFAFIRIPAPTLPAGTDDDALDALDDGMRQYIAAWDNLDPTPEERRAVGLVWKHTNQAVEDRAIGPAIVKDMLGYITNHHDTGNGTLPNRVTNAVISYIFPQLEGVPKRDQIVRHITDINSHEETADMIDRELLETAARDMLQVTLDSDS
ncbi:AAA family ATPase [Halorubrum rutilum]|uniref:AAA family ATPase n=1 Tax=Halorubrum rutilum TaxID=1364933 RepID=A0ABD6AQU7_9EURY|nr:AAA family ATPase [Halorubrum rutilum]